MIIIKMGDGRKRRKGKGTIGGRKGK